MWIQISSGTSPIECCRFVFLFLNLIKKECNNLNIKLELLDYTNGDQNNTLKSAFLKLSGENVTEYAKSIEGSILWICQSPYRKYHKRKNWFIEVQCFDEEKSIELDLKDIKIDTMRCSGKGGQNVNKLETGVRITHIPTKITVNAREERSQLQNKKLAMIRLKTKLEELNIKKSKDLDTTRWSKKIDVKRGGPIRTFKGLSMKEI